MDATLLTKIDSIIKEMKYTDGYMQPPNSKDIQSLAELVNRNIVTPSVITNIVDMIVIEEFVSKYTPKELGSIKDGTRLEDLVRIDCLALSRKTENYIQSLPREYNFIFQLPRTNLTLTRGISISGDMLLTCIADSFLEQNPHFKRESRKLFDTRDVSFKTGDTILNIKIRGFVSRYGHVMRQSLSWDPLYLFKTLVGYLEASNLFLMNYSLFPHTEFALPYPYYVYDNKESNPTTTIYLSNEDFEYIHTREFINLSNDSNLKRLNEKLDNFSLLLVDTKSKMSGVEEKLNHLRTSILNSLYWYYESLKVKQDHLKVVFLSTAFDAFTSKSNKRDESNKAKGDHIEYIAGMTSAEIGTYQIRFKKLLKLNSFRNDIIHGEMSIDTTEKFNKEAQVENLKSTLFFCSRTYEAFIQNRISYYERSIKLAGK